MIPVPDPLEQGKGSNSIRVVSDLVTATEKSIQLHGLLRGGEAILVAASGGLDSTVLLHVLHKLSRRHGWKIQVAHFNHQLRGRAASADERFVRDLSDRLDLPCNWSSGDVCRCATQRGLSIEMAARQLRHAFLAQTARSLNIVKIATAHHADDQIELFLMRLMRGGGSGLAGMKWINPSPADPKIRLIRPFLNQTRANLLAYARHEGIDFREDSSNRNSKIMRNLVRNRILPYILRLQPKFRANVMRTIEIIGTDHDYTRIAAEEWLARQRSKKFEVLHPAVQRQVIQMQLIKMRLRPNFSLIESLRSSSNSIVTTAPHRCVRRDSTGRLREQRFDAEEFDPTEIGVTLRGPCGEVLFKGLKLKWVASSKLDGQRAQLRSEKGRECFDADRVGGSIVLRHWRPGDRFRPIGMTHSVKLQDFFTNQRIPRARRHRLVVAARTGGEIFWVEGMRIGERFKIGAETKRILQWQWGQ